MSTSRPSPTRLHLTLDEQSFQGLLSAAFTIQEHNARRQLEQTDQSHQDQVHRPVEPLAVEALDSPQEPNEPQTLKQTQPPEAPTETQPASRLAPDAANVCRHCGAPKPPDEGHCPTCGLEQFRPGERLQHNWASMWLMSQKQRLWPERSSEADEAVQENRQGFPKRFPQLETKSPASRSATEFAHSNLPHAIPAVSAIAANSEVAAKRESRENEGRSVFHNSRLDRSSTDRSSTDPSATEPSALDDFFRADTSTSDARGDSTLDLSGEPVPAHAAPQSLMQRLASLSVTVRFHRADLYLGVSLFVAVLALLWPAAAAPRHAAIGPWERALITLGIAETPATPVVHLQGDPGIQVWVDTHSALYYCPGEEQYGKTPDGHVTSQREAQMDRFQPASRTVCD
jgi:ribosomal protein L40E